MNAVAVSFEMEPSSEQRVLEHEPLIALGGTALHDYNLGNIKNIQFNTGSIAVSQDEGPFSQPEFPAVVLSTLGFNAEEIGTITCKATSTIQSQLKSSITKVRNDLLPDMEGKAGLARYCFATGMYKLYTPGRRLRMSDSETRIMQEASYGKNAATVGKELYLAPSTVMTHIKNVGTRNSLSGKGQVILAAFLSGQIKL